MQISNLTITMKKDLRVLVSGFHFALNPGDKCAVIGEEGNGKSTLLKWIYDETMVEDYAVCEGEISKNGLLLGYLPQETTPEEREMTIYAFCCAQPSFPEYLDSENNRMLAEMHISPELIYSDRKIKTLSGGEKIRLRLALLMMTRKDVLLLDEPSNDIDIETLEWLEEFIIKTKIPLMYISHDETLLERTANRIIHIEQLRRKTLPRHTVEKTDYADYVNNRMRAFETQEQMARKEKAEYDKQQERFRQIYQKVDHDLNAISRGNPHGGRLLKKKMKAVKSVEKRFDREHEAMTELPDYEEGIQIRFAEEISVPAGKTILDFTLPILRVDDAVLATDIRLFIKGPEHVCIIGKNGAGKTTLLKRIADALLKRTDVHAVYMPQDYSEQIDERLTPVEFLSKTGDKEEQTRIKTILGSMKYTPEEFQHGLSELSGGQKAKLFFVRMILGEYDVLVLDEPTRNFSPLSTPVIREMLKSFRGTIISVSHDRKYIKEVCETVYELDEGGLYKRQRIE